MLIDGDRVMYTSGWAMEKDHKDGDRPALFMVDTLLDKLFEVYGSRDYQMFLTSGDESNFRFKVAKTKEYKWNRKDKKKPFWIKEIREYMIDKWSASEVFGMEADDKITMLLTSNFHNGKLDDVIAISDDKDIRQAPGRHGDFSGRTITVTDELGHLELVKKNLTSKPVLKGTGLKFLYAQMIMGDACDGIPGIPKMGCVAAYKTLVNCATERELYDATVRAYKGNEEYMDEQAQLVYMLREEGIYWLDHKKRLLNAKNKFKEKSD